MRRSWLAFLFICLTGTVFVRGQATQQAAVDMKEGLVEVVAPFGGYGHVYDDTSFESMRPRIMGTRGVVSTGHYLATMAGIQAFKNGGNAFDAGVTAAMALKVTKMGFAGWTGVAPLILYSAAEGKVITRVGAGTAPAKVTLEHFLEHGKTTINAALVPADVDVWLNALDRFGTISFREAADPALEIAEHGYHLFKHQKWLLDNQQSGILKFSYNVKFWYQHGVNKQQLGDLMVNKDLGRLIRYMIDAEAKTLTSGASRSEGIQSARDAFYKGSPAHAVDAFYKAHDGLITYEDLATYEGKWMDPLHTTYRGYDVYVCDAWSQGPRLILFLNLLEQFDLESLGYNTPEYIHVISQALNLGFADSHKYLGDPDFVEIPPALYSKAYAKERATLIDLDKAFPDTAPWGDPARMASIATESLNALAHKAGQSSEETSQKTEQAGFFDTTSLNVMDGFGNIFSMTESDGHMVTPMIPDWGFGVGNRMYQFNLDPALANVVAPGKRPRNTNTPVLIMKDGQPFMGISTPGNDRQLQAILQVFLNIAVWGMAPEQAVDQPRFATYNHPPSGSENNSTPARLNVEDRIPQATVEALKQRGHDVRSWGAWNWQAGAVTATYFDSESGLIIAAGDVRRETYPLGY